MALGSLMQLRPNGQRRPDSGNNRTRLCGLSTKTHVPLWERVKTRELGIYIWESRQRNSLPSILLHTAGSRVSAEAVGL